LIQDIEKVAARSIRDYADLIDAIFMVYAESKGKRRWGDKTPGYGYHLELLDRLFPNSRIVHLVRDGRDIAISLRGVSWGSTDLPKVAQKWMLETLLCHKMGGLLGERFLEIRYEELVDNPEAALRLICTHLGEPFSGEMLNYHKTAQREMPAESLQWHQSSIKSPDPSKAFAWKSTMSKGDLAIFQEIAGPALELFGYEAAERRVPLRRRLRWIRHILR
jgi:hypothetical protein